MLLLDIAPDVIVPVSSEGGHEIPDKVHTLQLCSHISNCEKPFAAIGCPAAHAVSVKGS